ncbi:MAG TPA: polysaccharide deacetylase family protein, partial [Acidimicrobiales bacterium]|nr:polysaccharide deacetylase family protein [Acidimicrobiales bacterium]
MDAIVRVPRTRRLRRVLTPRVAAFAAATLLGASLAVLQAEPAHSRPPLVHVLVNGVDEQVPGPVTTVDSAIRATGARPPHGRLLSALTHQVVDADFNPPVLKVDGVTASWTTPVRAGQSVEATPGPDETEPVVTQKVEVAPGGLPEVEKTLWYPGQPGADESTYGALSGELVSRQRTTEPVAPRPELAGVVALSFDDGPDPRWTPQILQILNEEGIKATFCVVGYVAQRYPELVKAERDQGHVLCDHTQHHMLHLDTKPHDVVVSEIDQCSRYLTSLLGTAPPLYRAPGGFLGPEVISVARGNGMRVLGWSIDPHDYERPPADELLNRILPKIRPGSVILLHDGGGDRSQTVAVLRPLIQHLKAMGWSFATPMFG